MPKVAIVYHYLAHYRLPVFKELMNSSINDYTLISDFNTTGGIKGIDKSLAEKTIPNNGLRWLFVKNIWLKDRILWQKGLMKTLRQENFDKVIFLGNVYYLSTWFAILYLKFKNKKIIFWTHGVTSDYKGNKWRLRKFFYNLADLVLLYGHKAKDTMIKNGFLENKLKVIYNSLDYKKQVSFRNKITIDRITQTKKQLFKNSELPYLVFVGRLTYHKKLDMLVDAVKICHNNSLLINALFIGEGNAKSQIEQLTKKYNLEDYIQFYGPCYDEEELSHLIGSADLCVSPGEVGLTAMTSLGYGTPVLSHNDFNHQMPEYEAIIPGVNGDLFTRDNIENLARKIESWLKHAENFPREDIQKNCFQIIDSKYNPKNQVQIIDSVI